MGRYAVPPSFQSSSGAGSRTLHITPTPARGVAYPECGTSAALPTLVRLARSLSPRVPVSLTFDIAARVGGAANE